MRQTSSAVIEVPVEQVHVETAGETGGEEGGPDSGRIEKLLGIIEFQKKQDRGIDVCKGQPSKTPV